MDDSYHIFYKFTGFWHSKEGIFEFRVCPELENFVDSMSRDDRTLFACDFMHGLLEFLHLEVEDRDEI